MIHNLKDYQAVFIAETGKYLVHLPAGDYYIAGATEPVTIHGYSGQTITVPDLVSVKIGTRAAKKLVMLQEESGKVVTLEEYNHFKNELDQYKTEFGTYHYPDLETEFELRHKAEYYEKLEKVFDNPPLVLSDIKFTLIGELADTGSEFITSSFEFASNGFWHGASPYRVNIAMIARDEFERMKKLTDKLSNGNHSGLRYAKFDDKSIFNDMDVSMCPAINSEVDKFGSAYRLHATLEAAKANEEIVRKYIRDKIQMYINADKGIDDVTALEMLQGLESVQAEISKFKLMKTSKGSKMHALNTINKLISRIKSTK